MKYLGLIFLLILLSVAETTVLAGSETESFEQRGSARPQVFYVSRRGNNTTGLSWETAWNELNQIRWNQIRPGATIYIDGGGSQMVYHSTMVFGRSGTATAPITIRTSPMSGRNGQVVFFGGRTNNLPYCGQSSYNEQRESTMREYAILSNGHDFVNINGMRWRGIRMNGFSGSAIRLHPDSRNITVENVEIYNNGAAIRTRRGWYSDFPGIRLAGQNITFRRVIIHDNGQDAIQSLFAPNNINNFRLESSWLYNGRRHPRVNESWNYCTHTDGIQIYSGGVISGVTIVESVLGPGFTQNVMFGQRRSGSGSWADVRNVTFRDVLVNRGADNGLVGYRESNSSNWLLQRVTIDCHGTRGHCLRIHNSNHTVRDSIVSGGMITFPDGLNRYSGNCTFNSRGFDIGREVTSVFSNISLSGMFALNNYRVNSTVGAVCVGSRITSAQQLLSQ